MSSPAEEAFDRLERHLHEMERHIRAETRRTAQHLTRLRSLLQHHHHPQPTMRRTVDGDGGGDGKGVALSLPSAPASPAMDDGEEEEGWAGSRTDSVATCQRRTRQLYHTAAVQQVKGTLARLWAALVEPWFRDEVVAGFYLPILASIADLRRRVCQANQRVGRGRYRLARCGCSSSSSSGGGVSSLFSCTRAMSAPEEEAHTEEWFLTHRRTLGHIVNLNLRVVPDAVRAQQAALEAHHGCFYALARRHASVRGGSSVDVQGHDTEDSEKEEGTCRANPSPIAQLLRLFKPLRSPPLGEDDATARCTALLPSLAAWLAALQERGMFVGHASLGQMAATVGTATLFLPDESPMLWQVLAFLGESRSGGGPEAESRSEEEELWTAQDEAVRSVAQERQCMYRAVSFLLRLPQGPGELRHLRPPALPISCFHVLLHDAVRFFPCPLTREEVAGGGGGGGQGQGRGRHLASLPSSSSSSSYLLALLYEKERSLRQLSLSSTLAWCEAVNGADTQELLSDLPMLSLRWLQEATGTALPTCTDADDLGEAGSAVSENDTDGMTARHDFVVWLQDQLLRLLSPATATITTTTTGTAAAPTAGAAPRERQEPPLPSDVARGLAVMYRTCPLLYVMEQRWQREVRRGTDAATTELSCSRHL